MIEKERERERQREREREGERGEKNVWEVKEKTTKQQTNIKINIKFNNYEDLKKC